MRNLHCSLATLALVLTLGWNVAGAQSALAPPVTRSLGSATLQNVPEIPTEISAAVQRYQNERSARFEDWFEDGSMLIATRFGASAQVHRVQRPGGDRTQLTFFNEPVASALALPGSQRFIIGRDTGGDEWFQLLNAGLTGPAVSLTQPRTRNQGAVTSRDGKLLAWSRAVPGSADYAIFIANPADATSTRLAYQGSGVVRPADFSLDGRKLLLIRGNGLQGELFQLDVQSGNAVQIAARDGKQRYEDAHFLDAKRILVISAKDSDVRRLVQLDLETETVTVLSADSPWEVETFRLSPDRRMLAYVLNEDGFSRVVLQELRQNSSQNLSKARRLPQPVIPRGVITSLGFSPDGTQLALGISAATTAGDAWTWNVQRGGLTRWTFSETGGLDPAELIEPTLIRFKSFDGLSVPALVYRPKAASERTPVIIDIHGGPEGQSRPSWNAGAQYFAAVLGATVILPNVRGSEGYGTRYLDLDNAEKREDSVRDIGALLDWIATQPDLDPRRVVVYGQSYGGYMSLASMTFYADRLVGGVERYGISDFVSFLKSTEAYRRDLRRAEYGDERDAAMLAVFQRIAPLANVAKITKPMLVMQGANDPRVAKSESDQIVAALRANGVPAWYVVFADEGHGFLKKPNNDLRREVETLFLRQIFK
jgi:dipeptidyl aminopeptidase/acylaminoacyl peptidase